MGNTVSDNELFSNKFENIQLAFINNKKSNNPICSQCDILKTCSACPGGMYAMYKSINKVIPVLCDFYVGFQEGILTGIAEASTEEQKWSMLMRTLAQTKNLFYKACDTN